MSTIPALAHTDDDHDAPDALAHRPRLLGLAYRMLGEVSEAEDAVQEGYLRWFQLAPAERESVRSPEAWLVTVVTRVAIDRLRRARGSREAYVGPWLPEPVAVQAPATSAPDRAVERASDLSLALLVLLERLTPEERAAFLLRELFDAEYAEIARILGRRPDAVRQAVHRARRRVRDERTRVAVSADTRLRMLEEFVEAVSADDAPRLLALLAPDVVLTSDGGGRALAARRPVVGADRVARFLLAVTRKPGTGATRRIALLNGEPALLSFAGETLATVTVLAGDDARVTGVYVLRNPEKLRRVLEEPIALR